MLAALAAGREVIVSRGELVEIGGGFRVPDVMAQSGARLREVGTTNRTRVDDYRAAIGPDTALLLRVHRSNFRIDGFTEQPTLEELVRARPRAPASRWPRTSAAATSGWSARTTPRGSTRCSAASRASRPASRAGVDIVCFSGDKLLGGPQAGILAGRARPGGPRPPAPADAGAARGQADLRGARGARWRSTPRDAPAARSRSCR